MKNYKNNVILIIGSVLFTIFLTLLLDYAVGWIYTPKDYDTGLIYPPNTSVIYKTPEFEFIVHTNELGFRGRNIDLAAAHQTYRILTLGDSFTYGWGVNEEDIWSTLLAQRLTPENIPVEVANLGWAGKGPIEYADVAEKAIPLLKPDLIIVAVLQGDDLQQLVPAKEAANLETDSATNSAGPSILIRNVLERVYPNVSRLVRQTQDSPRIILSEAYLQEAWQLQAIEILKSMTPEEKRRFQKLESEIQHLFNEGLLNPHLVLLGVRRPEYFLEIVNEDNPSIQSLVKDLAFQLKRIKKVAAANQAEVVVVSVPYGIYVNEYYMNKARQLGFEGDPKMLTSLSPDETIAAAAEQAGVRFFSTFDKFRQSSAHLFYDLDAHFTVTGNQLFAETLYPLIQEAYSLSAKKE